MRKLARRLLIVLPLAAVVLLFSLWCLYRASQQAPAFYMQALARQPASVRDEGQQFERQALALHNQLASSGDWEIRFTQDEINGWLAGDLPAKFPRALPPGVSEPRIAIIGNELHLAVHYGRGGVDTVVSLVCLAVLLATNMEDIEADAPPTGPRRRPLTGFKSSKYRVKPGNV